MEHPEQDLPRVWRPDAARRSLLLATAGLAVFGTPPAWAQKGQAPKLDVPYVPTPQAVVNKMLEMGKVKKGDLLYDLGCGDGRIVVTAARDHGARGVGIDIDPQRISEARQSAKRARVTERVEFRQGDLFETDLSQASVVTLYLLPRINLRLRPQLWSQLKVGTRVVSHAFDMGNEWPSEQTERVQNSTLYAWTIKPEHKRA